MKKKWLAVGVSICVVVLLVLGSLSNVIGYQSVKSTLNDSPLFQTRTQRATNQQQNIISSDYLGKGINALSFPLRDNRIIIIQQFIEKVRTMDDATFNNFITMMISILQKESQFHNVTTQEFLAILYQLKNTQNILSNKDIDFNHKAVGTANTYDSGFICNLLRQILWIVMFLYLYFAIRILSILFLGNCYDSLWGTCLLKSK